MSTRPSPNSVRVRNIPPFEIVIQSRIVRRIGKNNCPTMLTTIFFFRSDVACAHHKFDIYDDAIYISCPHSSFLIMSSNNRVWPWDPAKWGIAPPHQVPFLT